MSAGRMKDDIAEATAVFGDSHGSVRDGVGGGGGGGGYEAAAAGDDTDAMSTISGSSEESSALEYSEPSSAPPLVSMLSSVSTTTTSSAAAYDGDLLKKPALVLSRRRKCLQTLKSSSSKIKKLKSSGKDLIKRVKNKVKKEIKRRKKTGSDRWNKTYDPNPVVDRHVLLAAGFALFALAMIWPPLILLVTYVASKIIPYSFRVNDDASRRRQLYKDFVNNAENLPTNFTNIPSHIHLQEAYWENSRGMMLCTSLMTPKNQPIKALVCYCHGYTDSASFIKRVENQRFVNEGVAFATIEYEGHGRSDGPLGLISDWETMIADVSQYYTQLAESPTFRDVPVFLLGESMGGAVAFCTYNRCPDVFRGVMFCCPMCKISDDMLPPQWVIDTLIWMIGPSGTTSLLGYLPIAPSKGGGELMLVTHKDLDKRLMSSRCPVNFGRHPRLATARELIRVTQRISNTLSDFDAPFLVIHGKDDRVTDPNLSRALYEESKSEDKSIHLYEGMWHALMCGETDENIERVYSDCIRWVSQRC